VGFLFKKSFNVLRENAGRKSRQGEREFAGQGLCEKAERQECRLCRRGRFSARFLRGKKKRLSIHPGGRWERQTVRPFQLKRFSPDEVAYREGAEGRRIRIHGKDRG